MTKFNLLEEPWIPVLWNTGQVNEVGLMEAVLKAKTIRRIDIASPLEEVALHRLILSLLYRAIDIPEDPGSALQLLEEGPPTKPICEYLDKWHDRFYLFHEEAPFFQIPDLPENPPPLPWVGLCPEIAKGNNPTLFDHTTHEGFPEASYSEVARALIQHQATQTGGLLRRFGVTSTKEAPLASAAAFVVLGQSLWETLVLNLVPRADATDKPIWEVRPLRLSDVQGYKTKWPRSGVCRVYTWLTRGVRLLDEGNGVRYIAYGPGVEPLEVKFRDPMVGYRTTKQGDVVAVRLSVERSFWRDLAAMLPATGGTWPQVLSWADKLGEESGEELKYRMSVLGQVADRAKILDVRREVYPLPDVTNPKAQSDLQRGLDAAEKLARSLRGMAERLGEEVTGATERQAVQAFVDSLPLLRLYWSGLDHSFPSFAVHLGEHGAVRHWYETLGRTARQAWGATRHFVGTKGRHLKALAKADNALSLALSKLK